MPAPTKRSYRYTFGVDDPFLGSLHVEHVAPHSSSLGSDLDGPLRSDDLNDLQENIPYKFANENSYDRHGFAAKRQNENSFHTRTFGSSTFNSFLSSPSYHGAKKHHRLRSSTPLFNTSTNYIPVTEPSFSKTQFHAATSPMRNEDENPFICSESTFSDAWKQPDYREVKRPRILSETMNYSMNENFYQYGNDILSDVLISEQEANQPASFSLKPLEWLDERILETQKILNEDHCQDENIQFSTSFIDAFIEDLDKAFQPPQTLSNPPSETF